MGNKKGSKVMRRYMKSLVRLLSKPKDMYVHAITACSTHFPFADATMGFPTPNYFTAYTLPRTFTGGSAPAPAPSRSSTSSDDDDDDDLRHLLRSTSLRSSRAENHHHHLYHHHGCRKQPPARLPRSCSIGRIDEDKPCEFGYDDQCDFNVVTPRLCPPRSGRRRTRASRGVF